MLKITLAFFISMANIGLYGAYLIPIDIVFNKKPMEDRQELLSVLPLHEEDQSSQYTDHPLLGFPIFVKMLNKGVSIYKYSDKSI